VLLQLKQLFCLYLVHPEQQVEIHDVQQQLLALHLVQHEQAEVPVAQG
jgi:hypothetical protein